MGSAISGIITRTLPGCANVPVTLRAPAVTSIVAPSCTMRFPIVQFAAVLSVTFVLIEMLPGKSVLSVNLTLAVSIRFVSVSEP